MKKQLPKFLANVYVNIRESNDQLQREFLDCLKNREIVSKFSYWGEEPTQSWLKFCLASEYKTYPQGVSLLKQAGADVAKHVGGPKLNYISLGIGNGEKDGIILRHLYRYSRKISYYPIDISTDMIKAGLNYVFSHFHNIPTTAFVTDFKILDEIVRSQTFRKDRNFFSLLGNTMGNFNQVYLLNILRKSLDHNDFILIGVSIRKERSRETKEDIRKIIRSYSNRASKDFAYSPLKKAGIRKSDGAIDVEFNRDPHYPRLNRVDLYFRFRRNATAHYAGQDIVYKRGERILLYFSEKYYPDDLKFLLNDNGFRIIKFYQNGSQSYAKVLCRIK
ncbi:MAG: L-histidine N(alpha)-methyltransferase [Patescibacteria group bacterium]|nr:L-histidine N(alpha)-methyltransferase [Patescibacteria group bacterium]MDD5716101.1 L-histidine N(alpha)-methyltransferase [Patescibacteria group bacterium]